MIYLKYICECCNYKFHIASEISNSYVIGEYEKEEEQKILLAFEDSIIFKYEGRIMRFDGIVKRGELCEGMKIENEYYKSII